ncbi:hypothetical protein J2W42_001818 [Rhizobium tibeticum]|uniref:Lipoprotein n=1 Tax=Rhizobium tibeticum TaxID=501024 RepID=A0A1H8LX42_9HYPH|nr:hypothetical protein [Rhizobium tibeticum]MDP9808971.1 hypothetical protein [Rhizobium tibeticum]SEH88283.1 hypothetical protein RTCCBAU85039_2851 [Rhizobium tibeticum]SEO09693.1 hypothetical protein SAMN05216228_1011190 [Rhizobium tibeticum]
MRPRLSTRVLAIAATAVMVASCQTRTPAKGPDRSALSTMERVALGANACWFKSGDAAFADYRLAPELNSFSGRPRILVVHRGSPESRPLLVVQAEGNPSKLDAFGPMMQGSAGPRIVKDVTRWASGGKACG